ncbi:uncharacterized protein BDV14DRAFT_196394 [Aspergillus stella-maris]|uniref:uncharacterized protein n=1 Tax=Aspergillus stella-maris TaxID=1810926 RepID=UPI003CCD3E4A
MSDKRLWQDKVWGSYYRMILSQPQKGIHKVSGMAFFSPLDANYHSLQVPWDQDSGVVRPDRADADPTLLATAFVADVRKKTPDNILIGYIVHSRCWDVLRNHRIWRISGGDIGTITKAIQRKIARDWDPEGGKDQRNFYMSNWAMNFSFWR